MNKINIDGVIIVEGKHDVSYLSSFVNSLFFITNGCDLDNQKIEFLQRAVKVNNLIIMTDPDEVGNKLRKQLKNEIKPIFDTKIEQNFRKDNNKFGVAELTKESVVSALRPYASDKVIKYADYELNSLLSLNDNPQELRNKLVKKYRLINGNNKSLENQLRILKINKEEVKQFINGNK